MDMHIPSVPTRSNQVKPAHVYIKAPKVTLKLSFETAPYSQSKNKNLPSNVRQLFSSTQLYGAFTICQHMFSVRTSDTPTELWSAQLVNMVGAFSS